MKTSETNEQDKALGLVNLNGDVSDSLPALLVDMQRALYYGDALFESMRTFSGRMPWWSMHWERLNEGMAQLGMIAPAHWSAAFFENEWQKMQVFNHRLRLMVWRSAGGLYLPENNEVGFLMTTQKIDTPLYVWPNDGAVLGFSKTVQLPVDAFSNLKSLNTARYVQAAREARSNGWDDAVILNAFGRVCETSNSNIFWIKNDKLFTPPLSEGCVAGIVRKLMIYLEVEGLEPCTEAICNPATLLDADEVFTTNAVRGIQPVLSIDRYIKKKDKSKIIYECLIKYMLNI